MKRSGTGMIRVRRVGDYEEKTFCCPIDQPEIFSSAFSILLKVLNKKTPTNDECFLCQNKPISRILSAYALAYALASADKSPSKGIYPPK